MSPYESGVSAPVPQEKKLRYDDDDFLGMVRAERVNAVGMDNNSDTLQTDRERALDYYKGDMSEIPVMANRSQAVHTTVSDTIQQALPDLLEVMIGGEMIGAFKPIGEEDEEAAKQETEIVNNVITNENDSFGVIYDYIHDALLMKSGILQAWIEKDEEYEEETLQGQTALALQDMQADSQTKILEVVQVGEDPMVGPLYDIAVERSKTSVCVRIESHAPEDFAVARDTINVRDATYAVARSRPRAQSLKEKDYPKDLVDALEPWNGASSNALDQARDTAGENEVGMASDSPNWDLRQVEVLTHAIRVDAYGEGKPQIWRVVTNASATVLLEKVKLEAFPFCMGTPYRQPHRAYGRSLADLTVELQKIMTALLRLHLDGGFFALNARHEIDMNRASEHTIADYLNNTPGYPVRTKGQALSPLQSTKSDFNALESLEYMATVVETRTGVTRNAQGLNPDTLHDTARGAEALMTNAQKRLRLIARTLAETGLKDLFLLVHSLLRTSGADRPMAMRIKNKWVQYDPTQWGVRKDFAVEIGTGAGGREMDLQFASVIGDLMDKIVAGQASGAIVPAVVTSDNVFAFADWVRERGGIKKTTFFTDPESPKGQQLAQQAMEQAQKPDPEMAKVQAKAQLDEQQQVHKQQMDQAESVRKDNEQAYTIGRKQQVDQIEDELKRNKAANEADVAIKKADFEGDLAVKAQNDEAQLAVRQQDINRELAERQQDIDADLRAREISHNHALGQEQNAADHDVKMTKAENDAQLPKKRPGGDLDK